MLIPLGLVATEPELVYCHRATRERSAATVLPFSTKIVATAASKGLVAYKIQEPPIGHWIYDPVGKRLHGIDSTNTRQATALLNSLPLLPRQLFLPLPKATAVRKPA